MAVAPACCVSCTRDRLLLVPDASPGSGSDAPPAGALLGRAVEAARAEFEGRTWRAFWRMTVEGAAAADVARELGMTAKAVYVDRPGAAAAPLPERIDEYRTRRGRRSGQTSGRRGR